MQCAYRPLQRFQQIHFVLNLTTMTVQSISGCAGVAPIECVSPRKNKWKIRWNITEKEDGSAEWLEVDFDHKPSGTEIRNVINGYQNEQVDAKILSGFRWNDMPVWLSTENQFNYKASFDLAVQTNGGSLPVRFKFGTDAIPLYHDFTTIEELTDFYMGAMAFINTTLQEGWQAKDSIDLTLYNIDDE